MKSFQAFLLVSLCGFLAGCSNAPDSTADAGTEPTASLGEPATGSPATASTASASADAAAQASADETQVTLSPENTTIQFVGTHVVEGGGPDPNPRTGVFKQFAGTALVNGDTLKSVSVEIDTASLDCGNKKLTDHLNSPDFFDTREFPQATFQSTEIAPGSHEGEIVITGDLSLHGSTKEISFPAKVSTADGFTLEASFVLDRAEFGMDQMLDKVNKDVAMTVKIGK